MFLDQEASPPLTYKRTADHSMRQLGNSSAPPPPTPSHYGTNAYGAGVHSPTPPWMLPAPTPRSGSASSNASFNSQLSPYPGQAAAFHTGSGGSMHGGHIDPILLPPPSNQLAAQPSPDASHTKKPSKTIVQAVSPANETVPK